MVKLWLLHLDMSIVKTFISAERSGNFEKHLQAVEQHIDLSDARMAKDFKDIKTIVAFFTDHNPFSACSKWFMEYI